MTPESKDLKWSVGLSAVATLGAYALWRTYRHRSRGRSLLAAGRIRELVSLWSDVDGCILHSRASNLPQSSAPLPVVCVHGFGISSSYFVPLAELLATEFNVYAPDLPGHGRSQSPAMPFDIPQMANALVRWMDVVGLRRASVVGNSMGCQIAVDAAVRYPDHIARLVLIGPTMDPSARNLPELFRRFAIAGMYERLSLTKYVIADYSRMALRLIPELRFMLRDRIENKLPRVRAPSILVRGEHDSIATQAWVEEVGRLICAECIVVIPGRGHAVHFSAAEQVVHAITPFLAETVLSDAATAADRAQEARRYSNISAT
jgi:2-hydroxy-6-oxonona-2,4-dienedioate hydrolase